MKLLALDCSAMPVSAAVLENGQVLSSAFSQEKITHSQTLLPMIDFVLQNSLTAIAGIDQIAVNAGPGSFTGVRIGVAAAKGLAAPFSIPCVAVSTLYSIAVNLADRDCVVCAVMDARREQVYNAIFQVERGEIHRLCEDRAISCEELVKELKFLSQSEKKCVIIAGDGTDVLLNYTADLPGVIPASGQSRLQNAVSVGLAALSPEYVGKAVSAAQLEPVYLRLPQAQRELNNKRRSKANENRVGL